jgi:hypothetical protein
MEVQKNARFKEMPKLQKCFKVKKKKGQARSCVPALQNKIRGKNKIQCKGVSYETSKS